MTPTEQAELNLNCKSVQARLATVWGYVKAEQAEQEPVAWLYDWEHEGEIVTGWVTQDFETTKFNNGHNVRPLYAAPVQPVKLAISEEAFNWIDANAPMFVRKTLAEQATVFGGLCGGCAKKAADGWALYCVECWEKAEQRSDSEQMEPVAYFHWDGKNCKDCIRSDCGSYGTTGDACSRFFAAPVRTKDLTDAEIAQAVGSPLDEVYLADFRAVIAKFKEKNK